MATDRMQQSIESAAFMALTKRTIGPKEDPYLVRWILLQTPWFSVYVHKLVRSDYEKATHDHPWNFVSLVLRGYSEYHDEIHASGVTQEFLSHCTGTVLYRPATWRHRVIIEDGAKPGWTLVLTGPRTRKWGFWPGGTWCHWKRFNHELNICEAGPIAGRKGLD